MIFYNRAESIFRALAETFPDAKAALEAGKSFNPGVSEYQAMALFILAKRYNHVGANILEFGTAIGYSASMMAQGAPLAKIVTLDPAQAKAELARKNLRSWPNVEVIVMRSVDYFAQTPEQNTLDMIFVDGDHNNIALDLPWFNRLVVGGLLLCHDYTPAGLGKKSLPVIYAELNRMAERLGRPFDVCIVDDTTYGMAGFYRREGETV